jgi:hypothetical protein
MASQRRGDRDIFQGVRESERSFQEKGFPVKGRAGYFSGSKGEREVFSGEGLPSEGERGEWDIFHGD